MYNFCFFFSISNIQTTSTTYIHTHVNVDKAHNYTQKHMNTIRHYNNLGMYVRCTRVVGEIRFHHIITILYNILYYSHRSL